MQSEVKSVIRDVPMLECMPPGWKAIERAYGEGGKLEGKTYTRYHSLDGEYKSVCGAKQVYMAHCGDLGIPWKLEYAKYKKARRERLDREAEDRAGRSAVDGSKRIEMIALSQHYLGKITGAMTLGFPGWKCRWDYFTYSEPKNKIKKTFIAADGSHPSTHPSTPATHPLIHPSIHA